MSSHPALCRNDELPVGPWTPRSAAAPPPDRQQHTQQQPAAEASQQHTQQKPAASLQQLDAEGIRGAFSPIGAVLGGIRSLPDALHPGFRLELLMQLQADERQRAAAAQQQRRHSNKLCSSSGQQQDAAARGDGGGVRAKPQGAPAGCDARVPARYGPMQGYGFTYPPHQSSEYGRREMVGQFERLTAKLAQVGIDDFVVRGCPPPLPSSTTFAHFTFDLPPFQEVDFLGRPLHQQLRAAQRPFIPAGRSGSPDVLLRGQMPEVLTRLHAQLTADFPASFVKVFRDSGGAVVLSFDRVAALHEGDVTGYMNYQQVKAGSIMVEARLAQDPTRWAVVENELVFFVLRPPWCRQGKR